MKIKYDLSRILNIEKMIVYSPNQKMKNHIDTKNFLLFYTML